MSMTLKVILGVAAALMLFGVLGVGCVIGFNNDCVQQEAGLTAQYSQNQNNYSSYFNKLKETAQVPGMYAADLEKLYTGAIQGRYGEGGSKAVVQFIQEHNPSLDAKMYTQIQQVIESGRDAFEADQKTLLDKKRVYEVKLHSFPGSMLASMMGYPRVDLAKIDIVTNDETQKAFDTKKAGPITVR